MPTPRDQLPADATSLARRLAALEREVKELRASRRASYTTVQSGNLVVGAGGNIVVEDGSVTALSATGWKAILDPNDVDTPGENRPVLYFKDPNGLVTGAVNTSGVVGSAGLASSSGTFAEDTGTDWRWSNIVGNTDTGSRAMTVRLSDSDQSLIVGGVSYLNSTQALLGLYDSTAGGFQARVQVTTGLIALSSGRATVTPPASANPGLSVSAPSGHTGLVYLGQYNGVNIFTVDTSGNVAVTGQVTGQSLSIGSGTSSIGGPLSVSDDVTIRGRGQGRGLLAQTSLTSNVTSITTSQVALMTVPSATYANGRAFRVTVWGLLNSTTANTYALFEIHKGTAGGTTYKTQIRIPLVNAASANTLINFSTILTNATGADIATALVITCSVAAGTGQFSANATNVAYTTAEDVGLAADWPGQPMS